MALQSGLGLLSPLPCQVVPNECCVAEEQSDQDTSQGRYVLIWKVCPYMEGTSKFHRYERQFN